MEAFAKWVQTYQSIIVVIIGIIGWIANHQLSLRAQNKNFLNQLHNTARIDITSKLREYQTFLIRLSKCYSLLYEKYQKKEIELSVDVNHYISFLKTRDDKWSLIMKEYQILIPELEQAFSILNERDSKIKTSIQRGFTINGFDPRVFIEIIEQSLETSILTLEQISLIDDLLLYLQEKSFANITGKSINDTKFEGDNRPKFIIYDRKLKYVEGKEETNAL